METISFLKSVIDQDYAPIVICNLEHEIVYMNPSAVKRYEKWGGKSLLGKSLHGCHNSDSTEKINNVLAWFEEDISHNSVFTFHNEVENKDVYMIALRDDENNLIGYYEKHEYRNLETQKLYDLN